MRLLCLSGGACNDAHSASEKPANPRINVWRTEWNVVAGVETVFCDALKRLSFSDRGEEYSSVSESSEEDILPLRYISENTSEVWQNRKIVTIFDYFSGLVATPTHDRTDNSPQA